MPPPLAIWRHAARNKFCAVMKDVARQFTPVIRAKHTNLRAAASASRDPVTPTGAIRTDRDYWIPAFAGMTGATHETQSILPPENLRPGTVRKYPTACPPSAPSTLPVV